MTEPTGNTADADSYGIGTLDAVAAFIDRYVVFPSPHCLTAVTLWAAHTHTVQSFYVTPRLLLDSAEPGSGKTRVLELLNLVCRQPEMILSPTTAAIFRMLAEQPYTLLFDEVDTIFNLKNGGNYEDLRALLNAGYKRGATIPRCVGDAKSMKVQRFGVYAPVALAGLVGKMPSTITTRSIVIHMRKRAPGEYVEPFRGRDVEPVVLPIRDALSWWMSNQSSHLADARPVMPDGVVDRASELWEPLLAIADAAGGDWPNRARDACRYFVHNSDPGELSTGVRLLRDLRTVFGNDRDRMSTADILVALHMIPEAPWFNYSYGKPLDATQLAKKLKDYGVKSKDLKLPSGQVLKGYSIDGPDGLGEPWSRYLNLGATSATPATSQVTPVAAKNPVAAFAATGESAATHLTREVASVAGVAPNTGYPCGVCGQPMTTYEPDQRTHASCNGRNSDNGKVP